MREVLSGVPRTYLCQLEFTSYEVDCEYPIDCKKGEKIKLGRIKMMKKGEEYIGVVKKMNFPNRGKVLLETEGTEPVWVTVKGAIEGQTVRFRIQKKKNQKVEGRLLEVVEQAKTEQEAKCIHFKDCGGCVYQTFPYEEQLAWKEKQVRELMEEVIVEPYEFFPIERGPKTWHYRNKMEFSFGDEYKEGPLALGLHKKESFYDILTTNKCQIVHEDYGMILDCVLQEAKESGLSFYHKMTHQGYYRNLVVRRAEKTGEILIHLVTTSQASYSFEGLKEKLLALPLEGTIAGILHSIYDGLADVVKSEKTEVLYGREYIMEELLGLQFKISTFSFFQTNSLGAEVLYKTAREFIGDTNEKVVFDLYSGTGTIAQIIAPVAKRVVGVEIVEEAVEAARENAERNGLMNCEFIAGDVLKVLDSIEEKPDLIILDPPRDGIHPKALEKIIAYGVDKMVYISCKPTSLQRDLVMLQEKGYKVEKVCVVDMFPMTVHVETVCLLGNRNAKPDTRVKLSVDTEELQRVKNGEKI